MISKDRAKNINDNPLFHSIECYLSQISNELNMTKTYNLVGFHMTFVHNGLLDHRTSACLVL